MSLLVTRFYAANNYSFLTFVLSPSLLCAVCSLWPTKSSWSFHTNTSKRHSAPWWPLFNIARRCSTTRKWLPSARAWRPVRCDYFVCLLVSHNFIYLFMLQLFFSLLVSCTINAVQFYLFIYAATFSFLFYFFFFLFSFFFFYFLFIYLIIFSQAFSYNKMHLSFW